MIIQEHGIIQKENGRKVVIGILGKEFGSRARAIIWLIKRPLDHTFLNLQYLSLLQINTLLRTTLCIRHYSLLQLLQPMIKHNQQNITKQNLRQANGAYTNRSGTFSVR